MDFVLLGSSFFLVQERGVREDGCQDVGEVHVFSWLQVHQDLGRNMVEDVCSLDLRALSDVYVRPVPVQE